MSIKDMFHKHGHILGATLLISGTSVGAGMLALPVLTSLGGFLPSILIYVLSWLFMVATGLLLLEVVMWMGEGANIISMADSTLGRFSKVLAWFIYLFLYYSLNVAYLAEGGKLVGQCFFGFNALWIGPVIFAIFFGTFIAIGTKAVDRLNLLMMFGLIASYFVFVSLGICHINTDNLHHANWTYALMGLPIAVTSFGYQHIIPTVTNYMDRDVRKVKIAIIIGTALPLIFYCIWQWLVLGIVPIEHLQSARSMGHSAIHPLRLVLNTEKVLPIGLFFAFCALVSSFLGVSIGVRDFLADGLSIKKDNRGRILLSVLVFLPPMIIAITFPNIFLRALNIGGGLGCILLLGLLPIMMVWYGRYYQKRESVYSLPGGRFTLVLLLTFVLTELFAEVMDLLN